MKIKDIIEIINENTLITIMNKEEIIIEDKEINVLKNSINYFEIKKLDIESLEVDISNLCIKVNLDNKNIVVEDSLLGKKWGEIDKNIKKIILNNCEKNANDENEKRYNNTYDVHFDFGNLSVFGEITKRDEEIIKISDDAIIYPPSEGVNYLIDKYNILDFIIY